MIKKDKIKELVFKRAKGICEVPGCNNEASTLHCLNDTRSNILNDWDYAAICRPCRLKAKHTETNKTYNKLLREKIKGLRINSNFDILSAKFGD